MSRKSKRSIAESRVLALAILAVCLGVALAACGGSSSSSSTTASETEGAKQTEASTTPTGGGEGSSGMSEVDVGNGIKIPLSVKDMKIAMVLPGAETPFAVKEAETVEEVAQEYGIPVTQFNGETDVNHQYGLYQNVIDGGHYNVIITSALDNNLDCEILSKTAPEKGVVVVLFNVALCSTGDKPANSKGDALWVPGTLATVGISTNVEGMESWAQACAKEAGNGVEAVLLNGIPGSANYKAMTKAFETTDLDVVANYATSYQPSEALEKVSASLLSHPDLKVIAGTYPLLTEGAIQALKSASKAPGVDVKLCNLTGGTENMLNAVKAGEVTVDQYVSPSGIAKAATQRVIEAAEGKPGPRVIVPGENGEIIKSGTVVWPPWYTKQTAGNYEPTGA